MNTLRVLIFAAVHFAVLAAAFMISFSSQMARFENGLPATTIDSVLAFVVNILATPMVWYWNSRLSSDMGTVAEWMVIGVNSLVWGFLLEYAFRQIRQIRRDNEI